MNVKITLGVIGSLLLLSSCIKSEPLNPEADILSFKLPKKVVLSEAKIEGRDIFISIPKNADVSNLTPEIETTLGATITPKSGVPQDFSYPVEYTVVSESGKYEKKYKVILSPYMFYESSFETWESYRPSTGKYVYETPIERGDKGEKIPIWATSNKGVAVYQAYEDSTSYPVHSVLINGKRMARLKTDKGPGNILGIQYIPIVAGSLFTGTMNLANGITDPLSVTQFGTYCDYLPDRFVGRYRYKPGTGDYIDSEGKRWPDKKDLCAIYAVFYEVDEKLEFLDGHTILTHPNIIAITKDPHRGATEGDGLIEFDIPFEYKEDMKVDFEKKSYKLAVVFSSSYKGDAYSGTPGSEMIVDEVKIVPKN